MTGVDVIPMWGVTWSQPCGVAQGLARRQQRHVPQSGAGVRVEGVHRVALGRDEDDVVQPRLHRQLREIQRLRIDLAVHGQRAPQSERCRGDIREGQSRFG